MISPTIGRRVWYWPSDYDRGLLEYKPDSIMTIGDKGQACDAGIAYVHSDRLVNLSVADHNGAMHTRASVRLLQDDEKAPEYESYATWMPYQKANAEKQSA